jgi:hypothetical protein
MCRYSPLTFLIVSSILFPQSDPFDTIKVRIQTSVRGNGNGNGGASLSIAAGAVSSSLSSFRSLFQGMAAPLSSATLVNAIIFASYGSFTRLWENLFEGGEHHDGGALHGTMSLEGGVFIERDDRGLHEYVRHHDDLHELRKNVDGYTPSPSSYSEKGRDLSREEMIGVATSKECDSPATATDITTGNDDGRIRQNQNYLKIFACGAMAGTVQAFVICPMEHVKCRLQVADSSRSAGGVGGRVGVGVGGGPIEVCTSILRNHGLFRGLYRGMSVTLWRETPAFGMYFATYDTIKERVEGVLEEKDDDHPIPSHAHAWAASALAGGISGAWTWVIIYPFDVIKTHIQTSPLDAHLRKGMWTVGMDLVREHGWRHMFRGLGITVARAFPVNAIIFPTYEWVLLQLGDGG